MSDKQNFASLKSKALAEAGDDAAKRVQALNSLYEGKSSKELLETLGEEMRWTAIHVADYIFKDTSEGFGATTISMNNTVVIVIPLVGGEIIAARHLPSTPPPEKVKGIKIVDFEKSLFKDKEGNIKGQSTRVTSEWLEGE